MINDKKLLEKLSKVIERWQIMFELTVVCPKWQTFVKILSTLCHLSRVDSDMILSIQHCFLVVLIHLKFPSTKSTSGLLGYFRYQIYPGPCWMHGWMNKRCTRNVKPPTHCQCGAPQGNNGRLGKTRPNQDVINYKKFTENWHILSLWTNYSQFGHFLSTFCPFGQFFFINFL